MILEFPFRDDRLRMVNVDTPNFRVEASECTHSEHLKFM